MFNIITVIISILYYYLIYNECIVNFIELLTDSESTLKFPDAKLFSTTYRGHFFSFSKANQVELNCRNIRHESSKVKPLVPCSLVQQRDFSTTEISRHGPNERVDILLSPSFPVPGSVSLRSNSSPG